MTASRPSSISPTKRSFDLWTSRQIAEAWSNQEGITDDPSWRARFHIDRIACGDSNHCNPGGDPLPGVCAGAGESADDRLSLQPAAGGAGAADVFAGLR